MIMYASRTGTKKNLAALAAHGWRLLISATGAHRTEGFGYAIDNGAWTAFQQKEPFNEKLFGRVVDSLGADADFVVVPDVVTNAEATRKSADLWIPKLTGLRLYLAVQDGMNPDDLDRFDVAGVFVGGSTEWKLATIPMWRKACFARGMLLHVARVNSPKRIQICTRNMVTSIDGSNASRFSVNTPNLDRARRRTRTDQLQFDLAEMSRGWAPVI